MAEDRLEIIGVWTVQFQRWNWEYSFTADGRVTWRDLQSDESGAGSWAITGQVVYISWKGATTKESWNLPIKPSEQTGWYAASYGSGPLKAQKKAPAPASSESANYTGLEPSVDLPPTPPPEDVPVYAVPPARVPSTSKPVLDQESGAVIGYMYSSNGYYAFFDLAGNLVASDEIGLEQPLVDPIDFVFIVGGLARGIGRTALKLGIRAVAGVGSRAVVRALTSEVISAMRSLLRGVMSARMLKFTATTAERMATKGRYVPVQMLKMALRYGAREADPQGAKGAFQYTLKIIRSDPAIAPGLNPAASWAGKTYTLKVVVKEEVTSSTVLHFHYQ